VTVGGALDLAAAAWGPRAALVEFGSGSAQRRWTFYELRLDALRVARAMLERFRPGEHVAAPKGALGALQTGGTHGCHPGPKTPRVWQFLESFPQTTSARSRSSWCARTTWLSSAPAGPVLRGDRAPQPGGGEPGPMFRETTVSG
jgi:hypothetical protein